MEKDMKIQSKYNGGEKIWFFEPGQVKFFEGTITDVQSWDKWGGFHYEIKHLDAEGQEMLYNVEENKLYDSKEQILDTLFVADGQ